MRIHLRLTRATALFYLFISVITILIYGAVVNGASGQAELPNGDTTISAPIVSDEETEQIEYEPAFPLTAQERDLVERIVAAESRGESLEGQMAVAQVISCRAELWGKSITDVCTASGQFARPYTGTVSDTTKKAVRLVFDEGQYIIDGPVTHFYAHKICSPGWAKSKTVMAVIGSHTFMY